MKKDADLHGTFSNLIWSRTTLTSSPRYLSAKHRCLSTILQHLDLTMYRRMTFGAMSNGRFTDPVRPPSLLAFLSLTPL